MKPAGWGSKIVQGAIRFWSMVALIRNLQKRTILNLPVLLQNSNTLLEILRISHFDVNLVFVGKGFIKSLNLRYRRRNVTTDVLAFPYLEVSLSFLQTTMWRLQIYVNSVLLLKVKVTMNTKNNLWPPSPHHLTLTITIIIIIINVMIVIIINPSWRYIRGCGVGIGGGGYAVVDSGDILEQWDSCDKGANETVFFLLIC